MKVSHETLPGSKVRFAIEVEGERSRKIHELTLQRLLKTVQVPGFRKGKAPRPLLMQYVGAEALRAEVFEKLIDEVLREVRAQHEDLKPLGQFRLGEGGDAIFTSFRVGETLAFAAEIDVEPKVEVSDYLGMTVTVAAVPPDPEAPARMLAEFQRRRAPLVPVEGRPAALGDVVTIDYALRQPDGEPVANWEDATGVQVDLDSDSFFPDIVAGIVGMHPGETKEIAAQLANPEDVTAPSQPVVATVTLQSIKVRELPPLDDEFARSISQKETMAELQAYLEEREARAAAEETAERIQAAMAAALVERTQCEVPQTLVQQEVERLLQRQLQEFEESVGQEVLSRLTENDVRELGQMLVPTAIAKVKYDLALLAIAERENLEVTAEALAQRVAEVQAHVQERLDPKKLEEFCRLQLRREAAEKLVRDSLQIQAPEPTPESPTTPEETAPTPDD